jgi:hypothetical protein
MSICLEIVRADGRVQRLDLPYDRTTVGSSPEASICVSDAPELEPLHILLVPREQGVWLSSARNARTPALLDGKPFESGQLSLGSEIDVGSITFRVVAATSGSGKNHVRTLIVLITLLVIAVPLLKVRQGGTLPQSNAPAPELFPEAEMECDVQGEAAEKRGMRAAERARSKTLRYPFDAREGLAAVELYRAAAPCLEETGAAAQVAAEEKRLRQRIEDDYQVQRLHLERALGESDWAGAMVATRQLLALLADRPGEYRDWLASLYRFLDIHLTTKKDDRTGKDGSR